MKKILLTIALVVLLIPTQTYAALTYTRNVSAKVENLRFQPFIVTVSGSSIPAGSLLVISGGLVRTGGDSVSPLDLPTDNRGNTYRVATSTDGIDSVTGTYTIYYSVLTTTLQIGDVITLANAGGGLDEYYAVVVDQFAGASANPFDKARINEQSINATLTTNTTATRSQADELLYGVFFKSTFDLGDATFTAGTGYTKTAQVDSNGWDQAAEIRFATTTGTDAATMTILVPDNSLNTIVTFKAAGSPVVTQPTIATSTTVNTFSSSISAQDATSTERGFNIGTTTSYGISTSTTGTYGTGAFSMTLASSTFTCGTTYHVQAYAINPGGTGTSTDTTFVQECIPGAPTIGTATGGNAQASVTFTAPASNGGATIQSYTVTSSPGGFTGTGTASPITVTGLSNGTAYTFTVRARNGVGTGPASAASNSVTPSAGSSGVAMLMGSLF